jgi:VWFA-related protein
VARALGALIAVCLSAAPYAQTFRTAANVIAVEASLYDKDGKPVTDLTAGDFQIIEDGQPQPVQTIYLVSSDPNFVKGGLPSNAPDQAQAAESVRRELRSRVLVFVFDLSHLSADGYKRSRTAVENFLKEDVAAADMVGIVSSGTMLNNKIDTDKAALLKAMGGMKGPNLSRYNDMRAWPRIIDEAEAVAIARRDRDTTERVVQRGCTEQPAECEGLAGDEPVRQQVEAKSAQIAGAVQRDSALSLATFATLASGLARLPGTKNVLVFSDGFFTGELSERLKDIVTLAARNNVRFSTLDARGLSRDPRMQAMMGAQPLVAAGDLSSVQGDNNGDVLASLAIDTGGEMIQNRNDLKPGIDIIARTAGTYYVLGYAPNKPMDGKYHGITVKVTRPGLTVRARKGYVAVSANAGTAAASPPAPGRSAGDAARIVSDVAVSSAVAPASTLLNNAIADVSVPVPPAAPRFRPNSDKNVSALTKVTPGGGETSEVTKLADAGWDAYALGDVAVAQAKLSAAVATGKAAPWVSYALGFASYALGQYDSAARSWDSVRASAPEFMPVYFDLADAYISLGRTTDALGILRDAARRWPVEPEPQNALGTILVKRGALDEALDVFSRITTAKPADSLGFFNLGRTYHLRYIRMQQNVAAARLPSPSAIGDDDRQKAIAAYKRYLVQGGPFEKQAREAISALDWKLR